MKDLNKLREEDPKAYVRQMKRYVEMIENGNKDEVSLEGQLKIIREDWRDPIIQRMAWGYVIDEISLKDLAERLPWCRPKVTKELKLRGLLRTRSESLHLSKGNSLDVSSRLKKMLIGNLLGDAGLKTENIHSARFHHATIHQEYAEFLNREYNAEGLECTIHTVPGERTVDERDIVRNAKDRFIVESKSYEELKDWSSKWYPEGTKIVPQDFQLNPLTCLLWFLDDGEDRKSGGGLRLYTNCFSEEEVLFLIENFKATLNIEPNIHWRKDTQPVIYIPSEYKDKFLLYILPEFSEELEDCFGYKFM